MAAKKTAKKTAKTAKKAAPRKVKKGTVIGHVTPVKGSMHYVTKNGDVVATKLNRKGRPKGAKSKCAPKTKRAKK